MIELIASILTCALPRKKRIRWRKGIISWWHSLPVRRRAKKIGPGLRCLGKVVASHHTTIGSHVVFNGAAIRGTGEVSIGDYVHTGLGLRILTRSHNYKGEAIPYDGTFIVKPVKIADFVWIGENVMLLPGTVLGEGAIIQAGSVVHGEIPPLAIAGGNPAKVFAWRDAEKFARLKAEGRFH